MLQYVTHVLLRIIHTHTGSFQESQRLRRETFGPPPLAMKRDAPALLTGPTGPASDSRFLRCGFSDS